MAIFRITENEAWMFAKEMENAGAPKWLLNKAASIFSAEMTMFGMALVRALWYAYTESSEVVKADRSWFDTLTPAASMHVSLNYFVTVTDFSNRLFTLAEFSQLHAAPFFQCVEMAACLACLRPFLPKAVAIAAQHTSQLLDAMGDGVVTRFAAKKTLASSDFLLGMAEMNPASSGVWYLPDLSE